MVTGSLTNNTGRTVRRGLNGKLYPDSRCSLAYRGVGRQSRSRRAKADRPNRACQQSSTRASSQAASKKPRGQAGITSYGRRMVRNGAALLEEQYGRLCLTFGTATLPSLSPEHLALLLSNWHKVVHRFFEALARESERKGLDWSCIYVVEIQIQRWERSGEVALHLHWLCPGRKDSRSRWAISPKQVAGIWARVLGNILGFIPDCRAAIRLEMPKGSVAKELGKYLSKGCRCVAAVAAAGKADQLPTAWWGGTTKLKASVEESVIWLDRDQCLALIDRQDSLRESGRAWVLHHFIDRHDADNLPEDSRKFWVGATIGFNCDRSVLLAFIKTLKLQNSCA